MTPQHFQLSASEVESWSPSTSSLSGSYSVALLPPFVLRMTPVKMTMLLSFLALSGISLAAFVCLRSAVLFALGVQLKLISMLSRTFFLADSVAQSSASSLALCLSSFLSHGNAIPGTCSTTLKSSIVLSGPLRSLSAESSGSSGVQHALASLSAVEPPR